MDLTTETEIADTVSACVMGIQGAVADNWEGNFYGATQVLLTSPIEESIKAMVTMTKNGGGHCVKAILRLIKGMPTASESNCRILVAGTHESPYNYPIETTDELRELCKAFVSALSSKAGVLAAEAQPVESIHEFE